MQRYQMINNSHQYQRNEQHHSVKSLKAKHVIWRWQSRFWAGTGSIMFKQLMQSQARHPYRLNRQQTIKILGPTSVYTNSIQPITKK